MHYAAQFIAFLAVAFGIAIGMWSLYRARLCACWICLGPSVAILFSPLVIRPENITLRALACVVAVEIFFKTTDYARQRRQSLVEDRAFLSYAKFLVPFPVFLVRFGTRTRELPFSWAALSATGVACVGVALGFALVELFSHIALIRSSFLLDHTIKFLIFMLTIESLARVLYGLEQLTGFSTKPLIDDAWRSRTVGEFWWRYNSRIHGWFTRNVFRPVRASYGAGTSVCLTFLASAILHEIGFAIATSRIDGYQFAFFCLQAPAVMLWRYVERRTMSSLGKTALHGSTVVWMWATSVFFFHGVDRVFPFFYVSEPWLP